MKKNKLPKPNIYKILVERIEIGIEAGFNRAYEHNDNPQDEIIKEQVSHYIMLEICEYFDFD